MRPVLKIKDKRKFTYDIIIALFSLIAIGCVIWSLRNLALCTHDDLLSFVNVKAGSLQDFMNNTWSSATLRARISPIQFLMIIPYYFVMKSGSHLLYNILMYLPIVINVVFFAFIVGKRFGRYLGMAIPVFFFAFIQIDYFHNLMISYPLFFQIGFLMFLIGIELFLKYREKRKERYLWISALCMFDSFSAYESFITYFAVFFLIALFYNCSFSEKKLHIDFKGFLKQIKYHFIAVVLYIVIYLLCRKLSNFNYDGATVDTANFNLGQVINTLFTFAYSLLPLREFFTGDTFTQFAWSAVNLRMIIKAAAAACVFFMVLIKSDKIKLSRLLCIVTVSIVAGILFCAPHALTPKYQAWVAVGVGGFVPSFFSYYWIVLPLSTIGIFACNLLKKWKIIIVIILCIFMFFGSIFTDFSNSTTIKAEQDATVRYKMFDQLTKSSYYAGLGKNAAIYVEGFMGIHNEIKTLGYYGSLNCGKNYLYSKDINEVMKYENKYYLWYDLDSKSIYLARMTDIDVGDEVFVMSYTDSDSLNTFYMNKAAALNPVYVNGELRGEFGFSVALPVSTSKNGICISATDIILNTCKLTNGKILKKNEDTDLEYGSLLNAGEETPFVQYIFGWYPKETWGRWSEGKSSSLLLMLPGSSGKDVQVTMDVDVLRQSEGLNIAVYCKDNLLCVESLKQAGQISYVIPKSCINASGFAVIKIMINNPTSPANLGLSIDARELGIGVKSIKVDLK